jgi:2-oxoglutarate dehydrogenase E1 component
MDLWREFHGPNAAYVLELYERYRRDPHSVDPVSREAFARLAVPAEDRGPPSGGPSWSQPRSRGRQST